MDAARSPVFAKQRPALRRGAAVVALTLVAAAPHAGGRVFLRRGGGAEKAPETRRFGWQRAYQTKLALGGGEADLEVWRAPMSVPEAAASLREQYGQGGAHAFFFPGPSLGYGLARRGDAVYRFVLFSGQGPRETIVTRLAQSADAFQRAGRRAGRQTLSGYPGADPGWSAENRGTRLHVRVQRSSDDPVTVSAYFRRELAGAGWLPLLPGPAGSAHGLLLYARGSEIRVVMVESSGHGRGSVITLLHKELALAPET